MGYISVLFGVLDIGLGYQLGEREDQYVKSAKARILDIIGKNDIPFLVFTHPCRNLVQVSADKLK